MTDNYYNRTNTCDRCGNKLKNGARREKNDNGNWSGKWICITCYHKDYYVNVEKKRPNSQLNIMKSLSGFRTGYIDQNSRAVKGRIFEQITVKVRGVKNLNIENNNFNSKIDHSRDPEYGIIESRGSTYYVIGGFWKINFGDEHEKEFDHLFVYCADENMRHIKRVYIFPKEEVTKRTFVRIYNHPLRPLPNIYLKGAWYDKYRVDERPYDDALQNIMGRKK